MDLVTGTDDGISRGTPGWRRNELLASFPLVFILHVSAAPKVFAIVFLVSYIYWLDMLKIVHHSDNRIFLDSEFDQPFYLLIY